jgi:CDP-diacylglycerol--serine O-phosphatidyltransferase
MAALSGNLESAALWIIASALFDFFDGFAARLLKVASPIGKELDSLSDVVSFGVAPAMIIYTWLSRCLFELPPHHINAFTEFLPYTVLLVPVLSAVRLAKFNLDDRQTTHFLGLPTPANALFLSFVPVAAERMVMLNNFWVVWLLTLFLAVLLVSEITMISLKFKDFKFKGINIARYVLLLIGILLVLIFRMGAFPIIILAYLLISFSVHALIKMQVL